MFKKLLLSFIFFVCLLSNINASHTAGADITYTQVGQDSFMVRITIYRSCQGINWTNTSVALARSNSCGHPIIPVTLPLISGPTEISPVCPGYPTKCTNPSSALNGYQRFIYEALVVMPPCNSWMLSYALPCCRNNPFINSGMSGHWVYATMNSNNFTVNSSKPYSYNNSSQFLTAPIPYFCIGQPISYNVGAVDPDGDSLVYMFETCYNSGNANVGTPGAYNNNYSAMQPMPGITIDQFGILRVIPTLVGKFLVCVRIEEYDRCTKLMKGNTFRDLQVVVEPCSGVPPIDTGIIANFIGSGTHNLGSNVIEACMGETISFDIIFGHSSPTGGVTLTSNFTSLFPGGTFDTLTVSSGNCVTNQFDCQGIPNITSTVGLGNVANTATSFPAPYGRNNSTSGPAAIRQQYLYRQNELVAAGLRKGTISTFGFSNLIPTNTTCNFTPNTCPGPLTYDIIGSATQRNDTNTYPTPFAYWTTNNTGGTGARQQYLYRADELNAMGIYGGKISEIGFNIESLYKSCKGSTSACSGQLTTVQVGTGNMLTQFNEYPSPYAAYNPGTGAGAGTRQQFLYSAQELRNAGIGAGKLSSITFEVFQVGAATINGFTIKIGCTSKGNINDFSAIGLSTVLGPVNYNPSVGINTHTFTTPYEWDGQSNIIVEICSNPLTKGNNARVLSAITPFPSAVYNMANVDVCNSGTVAGVIYQRPNAYFTTCAPTLNYTIKMGCVATNTLMNWQGGLTTVYTNNAYAPKLGWNMFTLNNALEWDGVSHVVVEVCSYAAQKDINYTTSQYNTPYLSTIVSHSNSNICALNPAVTTFARKPRLRIGSCKPENKYSIKIGCTTQSSLSNWITGLSTVYTKDNFLPSLGFNEHNLDASYDWDGISNLVVEICYESNSSLPNFLSPRSNTTYNSVLYYAHNDTLPLSNVCDINVIPTVSTTRPNIRFNYCRPFIARFTWTANDSANVITTFLVSAKDNSCPVPGIIDKAFQIIVRPNTFSHIDTSLCMGDSLIVGVVGGNSFDWSILYGTPIIPGVNFFADTTATDTNKNVILKPTQTTAYLIENKSDIGEIDCIKSAVCKRFDTLIVRVGELFMLESHNDTLICPTDGGVTLFSTSLSQNYTYTFDWFANGLHIGNGNVNLMTSTIHVDPKTTTQYVIKAIQDSGCIQFDTILVETTPMFPKGITATANFTAACSGLPSQMDLVFPGSNTCGIDTMGCFAASSLKGVGQGVGFTAISGQSAFPSPFMGIFMFSRQQYLIRSTELAAVGITAGKLTSVAFDVVNVGSISQYNSFTIRVGCTTDQNLVNWRPGLQTVVDPRTVNVTTGWNTIQFDYPFSVTPGQNLVVEVCFANTAAPGANNTQVRFTGTAFPSSIAIANSGSNVCNNPNMSVLPLSQRPNMRFNHCPPPDPNAFNFVWDPPTGLSNPFIKNPIGTITPGGLGTTYTVIIADTFGKCFDTTNIWLTAAIVNAGNDTVVCIGDTIQLHATPIAACQGNVSYSWGPAAQLINPNTQSPTAVITSTTTFIVTMTDNCGCIVSDTVVVRLSNIQVNTALTYPNCNRSDGVIQVNASNGISPYMYSIDSGITYQASSSFPNLGIGYYTIMVQDSSGCYSNPKNDTLYYPTAPTIDTLLVADAKCFGSSDGVIEVIVSGGLAPYMYSVDSGLTYHSSNRFSTLPKGVYKVYAMSNDSCYSFPKYTEINHPTKLLIDSLTIQDDSCYQSCTGFTIGYPSGGTPGYNYLWSFGAPDSSYAGSVCGGTHTLQVRDSHQCVADTTFTVGQPPQIIVDSINVDSATCNGLADGRIFIYAQGGVPPLSYSITGGSIYSNITRFDSLLPGFYNVIIKDNFNCTIQSQFHVLDPPKVEVQTSSDTVYLCVGGCTTIKAMGSGGVGGPYTFTWNPNPMNNSSDYDICPKENTVVSVFASDRNRCASNIATVRVLLYDSLKIVIPNDTSVCPGDSVILSPKVSGGDRLGYIFSWQPFRYLNNPNIQYPTSTPLDTVTYTLTLNDNCGSPKKTASITITPLPLPNVAFKSDIDQGCEPLEVTFYNNSTLSKKCHWDFGDGVTTQGCVVVRKVFRRYGVYDVTLHITSSEGCENAITYPKYINVYPTPLASFSMTPLEADITDPTILFNDLSMGPIKSWFWNFGSFGTSDMRNPSYTFPAADTGTYPVKLIVVTDRGCKDDTIMYAKINTDYLVFVPKAFTPNNDGLNEKFKPITQGVRHNKYHFMVFDRWGSLIFESFDQDEGWDGNDMKSGKPLGQGAYVWKLDVSDYTADQKTHTHYGTVYMFR